MVEKAITSMLEEGARRVVVPGCGALIKRDSGALVFTDLLRTDDGMLAAALARREGIPGDRARILVEGYAAALNAALAETGRAVIPGTGVLVREASGSCTVMPDGDDAHRVPQNAPAAVIPPACTCGDTPPAVPGTGQDEETPPSLPDEKRAVSTSEAVMSSETAAKTAATSPAARPNGIPPRSRYAKSGLRSALYGDERDDDDEPSAAEPSALRNPQSRSAAIRSSAAPVSDIPATGTPNGTEQEAEYTPHINIRHPNKPKKRMDVVLIIAAIALVITIGVLVYGFLANRDINAMKGGILIEASDGAADTEVSEAAE